MPPRFHQPEAFPGSGWGLWLENRGQVFENPAAFCGSETPLRVQLRWDRLEEFTFGHEIGFIALQFLGKLTCEGKMWSACQRFVLSAGQCRSKWLGLWALSPGLPFAACDRASCCSLPSLVPFCERENEAAEGVSPGPGSWKTRSQCGLPLLA